MGARGDICGARVAGERTDHDTCSDCDRDIGIVKDTEAHTGTSFATDPDTDTGDTDDTDTECEPATLVVT